VPFVQVDDDRRVRVGRPALAGVVGCAPRAAEHETAWREPQLAEVRTGARARGLPDREARLCRGQRPADEGGSQRVVLLDLVLRLADGDRHLHGRLTREVELGLELLQRRQHRRRGGVIEGGPPRHARAAQQPLVHGGAGVGGQHQEVGCGRLHPCTQSLDAGDGVVREPIGVDVGRERPQARVEEGDEGHVRLAHHHGHVEPGVEHGREERLAEREVAQRVEAQEDGAGRHPVELTTFRRGG
jgi:hypothetical protein